MIEESSPAIVKDNGFPPTKTSDPSSEDIDGDSNRYYTQELFTSNRYSTWCLLNPTERIGCDLLSKVKLTGSITFYADNVEEQ